MISKTSIKEFNKIFAYENNKTSPIILCIGALCESSVERAKKMLDNKGLKQSYLNKIIFAGKNSLAWQQLFFWDRKLCLERVRELYGDDFAFKKEKGDFLTMIVYKNLKRSVTVKDLLVEMDKLGRNFPECGFFMSLDKISKNTYDIDWSR